MYVFSNIVHLGYEKNIYMKISYIIKFSKKNLINIINLQYR